MLNMRFLKTGDGGTLIIKAVSKHDVDILDHILCCWQWSAHNSEQFCDFKVEIHEFIKSFYQLEGRPDHNRRLSLWNCEAPEKPKNE